MEDLISIIIPVYNVEQYVTECLDSVINQTYSNLDIIIVNDGSTDNSYSICKDYANRDSRITLLTQENKGLSAARNVGLVHAKGKLISFIDSDDFISENFIETLYLLHQKYNADITEVASLNYFDGIPQYTLSNKIIEFSPIDWITQTKQKDFISVVVWNKLYRKELFDNIRFPIGKKFEDEATTYKLIYKSNKVIRSYSKFYAYRQRQNSIINTKFSNKDIEDRISIFEEKVNYFDNVDDYIYDFCIAKLLILLFSILKGNIYNNSQLLIDKVFKYYNKIKKFRKLPFKYKIYIKLNISKIKRRNDYGDLNG